MQHKIIWLIPILAILFLNVVLPVRGQDSEDKFAIEVLSGKSPEFIVPKVDVVKDLKLTDEQIAAVWKALYEEPAEERKKFDEDAVKRLKESNLSGAVSQQLAKEDSERHWKKN